MMRRLRPIRLFAALLLASGWALSAHALGSAADLVSTKEPVLMRAEQVAYDEPGATAVAEGNVEIVQGETILLADKVTYNQTTDVVHAVGHVSVVQPGGDVFFSDEAIFRDQLQKGIVSQFRARLSDNSLFAAREAEKVSKDVTVMHQVVYSPCDVCAPKPGEAPQAPLWQMRADEVTVDQAAQRVKYRDAFMEVYGVPMAYTPYFSHPTPDAPSQTGLLQPQYYHDSNLGNVVKQPVFISIAPNMDATITPWYLSGERPLVAGEFRQLTEQGHYEIHGALTDTYNRDDAGNIVSGTEARGFIEAHGKFQLNPLWDAGIDAERVTDDTFLQLYGFGWQDMLLSRLYAERIEGRSYGLVQSLAFQGLQPQDDASLSPYVLPQASYHFESDPLGESRSRVLFDASALVLERQQQQSSQRLSSTVGWRLPYVTANGQVIEATASMRGDAYYISDQVTNPANGDTFNGTEGRVIPQIDVNWRYPFVNRFGEGKSLMIAPVVELAASPNLHVSSRIPNEDSQIAELTDANLFSADRFTGLDQVESGFRGAYGVRGQATLADAEYLQWLLGQAYQESLDSPFPIAHDANAHFSDYIGSLALKYRWLDVAYRFRVDRQSLVPTSNEVTMGLTLSALRFDATYISLKDEPLFGDRKEVFGNIALDLTPHWTYNLGGRKDLGSSQEAPVNTSFPVSALNPLLASQGTVGISTGLTFHNECMLVTTTLGRSYISQQDVKPSTTVAVMVVLKNFSTAGASKGQGSAPGKENILQSDANNAASTNAMTNAAQPTNTKATGETQ